MWRSRRPPRPLHCGTGSAPGRTPPALGEMMARGVASVAAAAASPPAAAARARGAFIVLEGVDRCGKTTQCKRLVEALKADGVSAERMEEGRRRGGPGRARPSRAPGPARALPPRSLSPPGGAIAIGPTRGREWGRSGGRSGPEEAPARGRAQTPSATRAPRRPSSSQVPAEMWRFPDRTTSSGAVIDAYLRSGAALDDGAIHLLFSANRWEKRAALLSALAAGTTLVVDRYAFSGVAFTAAKGAPGLGAAWCAAPDAGLPAPDAVLHLTLDPAAAAQRGGFGEERYEEAGMLATVAGMLDGMRADRAGGCEWARVDADGTIDAVAARVRAAAAPALERAAAGAPVKALWEGGALAGWPPAA